MMASPSPQRVTASNPPSKGRVIVFGFMFGTPLAGVIYQYLHYLLGLRSLGYDPFYVEDLSRWVSSPVTWEPSQDASPNIRLVAPVLEKLGFGGRWAFRGAYEGGECYGMTEAEVLQLYRDADAMLNVTGAQELREEHLTIRRRIYIESDPFKAQVELADGLETTIKQLGEHHVLFSFGENLGQRDCDVPIERFTWLPTRQPVAMELWESGPVGGEVYTTITTWRNKVKPVYYRGEPYYWTKDIEWQKYLDLPRRTSAKLELATGKSDEVRQLLLSHGWRQTDCEPLSYDIGHYHQYILGSRGEFTIARDQYVRPRTGWFSDRSACYLAAGRPVITAETGFSKFLPSGKGLFGFSNMDEAVAAIEAVEADYAVHCRAAREIGAEYFAAEKVVGSVMARAGL